MRLECDRVRAGATIALVGSLWLASTVGGWARPEPGGVSTAASSPDPREVAAPQANPSAAQSALVWDSTEKVIDAQPGDSAGEFAFTVTNVSDRPVTIYQVRPTCGCTVAEMPASPWIIAPGKSGTFVGTIDFRGKEGTVTKSIFVNSTGGTQRLTITVKIPTLDEAARKRNQAIAQQNRQAVFSGDCARCHVTPAKGLSGADLFLAACGVCHFAERRSSIVPDLLTARQHRDAAFWRRWISEGKNGTLMPAWSKKFGGPLTDDQIESLVKYALETLPTEPPEGVPAGAPPAANRQ